MGLEIERKWRVLARTSELPPLRRVIRQGYLSEQDPVVRVRTMGEEAFLTIKSAKVPAYLGEAAFMARTEFEYPIPMEDALQLLELALYRLDKTRYYFDEGFEYDVFEGPLSGLELVEFESVDPTKAPPLPEGVTAVEITGRRGYSNLALARDGMPPD